MTETYTPAARVVVVASLLFAIATMTFVTVSIARAAGALAVGSCGAFGEAYDYASVAAAHESALAKCQGDACRVVTTSKRTCTAFAVDFANPCGAFGWGQGGKLGVTQNAALEACYREGGKECVIRTFFCDARG
ncbi:DUF4189 domain-containing protein [Undibacter mobilis]|uniref:DUF4189 domain-containing protein n=1 Tax=Undibacter mobilis TaxID=2292256 RepID=A0A371BCK9_9BRAD|nr:DUF4189 domain-containing protein [Undibacter mobilis]RDV05290.1 DUF4189 domain-containing protein [Undibacter mobilis]